MKTKELEALRYFKPVKPNPNDFQYYSKYNLAQQRYEYTMEKYNILETALTPISEKELCEMYNDNKSSKLRERYNSLRAVGFTAKEANKYKHRSDYNVNRVIIIKRRYNLYSSRAKGLIDTLLKEESK